MTFKQGSGNFTLFLVCLFFCATPAQAEIRGINTGKDTDAFYEDSILTGPQLVAGCGFNRPDFNKKKFMQEPAYLPPECVGYFKAIGGHFHGPGAAFLPVGSCANMMDAIPDMIMATMRATYDYAHTHNAAAIEHLSAEGLIIKAVIAAYPCKTAAEDVDNGNTYGTNTTDLP